VKETSEGPSEGPSWDQVGTKSGPSWDQAKKILSFCLSEHTLVEIMTELQMASRNKFRKNYIMPLLNNGLLERTQPDKPNSSKQMYVITAKGKGLLSQQ
jgi:predicted transcriptional regulator